MARSSCAERRTSDRDRGFLRGFCRCPAASAAGQRVLSALSGETAPGRQAVARPGAPRAGEVAAAPPGAHAPGPPVALALGARPLGAAPRDCARWRSLALGGVCSRAARRLSVEPRDCASPRPAQGEIIVVAIQRLQPRRRREANGVYFIIVL